MPEATDFRELCAEVVAATDSSAAVVSRLLGDVLIQLVEHVDTDRTLNLGQGYLASDFPLTMEVIELREPRAVWAEAPGADPNEVRLLRELGYGALLMLPIVVDGQTWGLLETYRSHSPYSDADAAAATACVTARIGS